MTEPMLLTLGYGYSAARLAASLPEHWHSLGTTRSKERAAEMRARGITPVAWEDRAEVEAAIGRADYLLVSVAPGEEGDPVLVRHGAALRDAPARWIGYLSTTGVYGDRQGGWVDEGSALRPVNDRSKRRVDAETTWLGAGLPVHVFRLAGIYGPGRSAFDRLRAGRAQRIVKPGQVFSRIHVDDIARVLRASLSRPSPGRIYNVADDEPAPPQDVIAFAARLIGVPVPPAIDFAEADLSPMARSFFAESKRVSNRRLGEELGVRLAFPDYRAGLRAILDAGG